MSIFTRDANAHERIQGITYDETGNYSSIIAFNMALTHSLTSGVGTLSSFTRSDSDATVKDFEGLVKDVTADEARFVGARRVETMVEDLDPNNWASKGSVLSIVPNGTYLGQPVWRVTTIAGFAAPILGDQVAGAVAVGDVLRCSLYYRHISGSYLVNGLGIRTGNTTLTNVGIAESEALTEWTRVAAAATPANSTTLYYGVSFIQPDTVVFDICMVMAEDVSGQTNQNPSEFVSVGVGTGPDLSADPDMNIDAPPSSTAHPDWALGSSTQVAGGNLEFINATAIVSKANAFPGVLNRLYAVEYEIEAVPLSFMQWSNYATGWDLTVGKHTRVVRYTGGSNLVVLTGGTGTLLPYLSIREIDHGSNVDGVKYFPYTNPNSVSSNIVTSYDAGASLLTNGNFATDDTSSLGGNAGWGWSSQPDSWEISGGQARHVGAGIGVLFATTAVGGALTAEIGRVYELTYTIAGASLLTVNLGGNTSDIDGNPLPVTVGTYTRYVEATALTTLLGFVSQAAPSAATVDNVSVSISWVIPENTLRGVLIEQQSTNLIADSDDETSLVIFQMALNAATSQYINGANKQWTFFETATSGYHSVRSQNAATTAFNNTPARHSFYVSAAGRTYITCYNISLATECSFNLATGLKDTGAATTLDADIELVYGTVGIDAIFRITCETVTDGVVGRPFPVEIYLSNNTTPYGGAGAGYIGDPTKGIKIGGFQTEILTYSTSYIPTSGGTAQRNNETLQYQMPTNMKQASVPQGTIVIEVNDPHSTIATYALLLRDLTSTHAVEVGSDASDKVIALGFDGALVSITSADDFDAGRFNLGSTWEPLKFTLYRNGVEDGNSPNAGSLDFNFANSVIAIGSAVTPGFYPNATFKNAKIYNRALPDAKMLELTS